MTKDEADEIADDEWLYRRVHLTQFPQGNMTTVSDGAFEPRIKGNQPDYDGISLFRASCLDQAADILVKIPPEKVLKNGIVRVRVSDLKGLGLTVESRPDEIKGHVIIPQLNKSGYESNKKGCQDLMHALAKMASEPDNVILRPRIETN